MQRPKNKKNKSATVTFTGLANDDTHFAYGDLNKTYELQPKPKHEGYYRFAGDKEGPYDSHPTIVLKVGPPHRVTFILRSDITTSVPFDGTGEELTVNNQIPNNSGTATIQI